MKHKLLNPLRLLMVAICMLGIAAEGQEVEFNGLVYTLNPTNKTAKLLQQWNLIDNAPEEITIEPLVTYEGEEYTVTEVGWGAFNCLSGIKKINLPETLKKIGESAFYMCYDLESMVVPNSADTIMASAFGYCESLKEVKLSENMTVLPYGIFLHCTSLTTLELPNSITRCSKDVTWIEETGEFGGDAAFWNDPSWAFSCGSEISQCENLKTLILPNHLNMISTNSFTACYNLGHIELPSTVTEIRTGALVDCGLKNLELPPNAKYLSDLFITPGPVHENWDYVKTCVKEPIPNLMFAGNDYPEIEWPRCPFYVPKGTTVIYRNVWYQLAYAPIIEATPVELTSEWRTFCAYEDLDFSDVEGLTAYIATGYEDGELVMEPIEQVPAGTGVVLRGEPGFYEIPYPDQDEALDPVDNLLVGLNYGERIQAESEEGMANLYFNEPSEVESRFDVPTSDTRNVGDQPAFDPADGSRLPYHRAYLQLPGSEAGKTVVMTFGDNTGIDEVVAEPSTDGPIYNLQGQRVTNPGPGIYIQNGRKFIIR